MGHHATASLSKCRATVKEAHVPHVGKGVHPVGEREEWPDRVYREMIRRDLAIKLRGTTGSFIR